MHTWIIRLLLPVPLLFVLAPAAAATQESGGRAVDRVNVAAGIPTMKTGPDLDRSGGGGIKRQPAMSGERADAVRAKLQRLLVQIFGHGRSVVRVTVDGQRMSVDVAVQGLAAERVSELREIIVAVSEADVARRGDSVIVRSVSPDDAPVRVLKDLMDTEAPAEHDK